MPRAEQQFGSVWARRTCSVDRFVPHWHNSLCSAILLPCFDYLLDAMMNRTLPLLLLCACLALAERHDPDNKPIRVLIQTDKGDIEVELDPAKAPATIANFLRY